MSVEYSRITGLTIHQWELLDESRAIGRALMDRSSDSRTGFLRFGITLWVLRVRGTLAAIHWTGEGKVHFNKRTLAGGVFNLNVCTIVPAGSQPRPFSLSQLGKKRPRLCQGCTPHLKSFRWSARLNQGANVVFTD